MRATLQRLAEQLLTGLVVLAGVVAYLHFQKPAEPPAPLEPTMVQLAGAYAKGVPAVWHADAKLVRDGKVTTKQDLVAKLREDTTALTTPLGKSIERAFSAFTDDAGRIDQAGAAADLIDRAATAMEHPK